MLEHPTSYKIDYDSRMSGRTDRGILKRLADPRINGRAREWEEKVNVGVYY